MRRTTSANWPRPAGLAHEAGAVFGGLAHRLAVGDLGPPDGTAHAELARHPVDDDLQVEFPHAGDDGLRGFFVVLGDEGGVFFGQLAQRLPHFVLVGPAFGLDGDGDDGVREDDVLEDDLVVAGGERVAGERLFEADDGGDAAGVDLVDLFAIVGVYAQQAADAFLLVAGGVGDGVTVAQDAGVDARVGEAADVGVGDDLEDEGGEWGVVQRRAIDFGAVHGPRDDGGQVEGEGR